MRVHPDDFSGFCLQHPFFFFSPSASDNIPKADEIRTLVKDTWDTRMAKLRLSADSFVRQQEAHAKVWGQRGLSSSARGSPEGWGEKSCGFCASPAPPGAAGLSFGVALKENERCGAAHCVPHLPHHQGLKFCGFFSLSSWIT